MSDVTESPAERAASLYRAANAICGTDLKTAIELRQLAGRIERDDDHMLVYDLQTGFVTEEPLPPPMNPQEYVDRVRRDSTAST